MRINPFRNHLDSDFIVGPLKQLGAYGISFSFEMTLRLVKMEENGEMVMIMLLVLVIIMFDLLALLLCNGPTLLLLNQLAIRHYLFYLTHLCDTF